MATRTINSTQASDHILVANIRDLSHSEAGALSRTEIERVISLVETLTGDDWQQPTDCTEWTIRDMVAHLAGACAGSTSFREYMRQAVANPYMGKPKTGIDAINVLQIEERKHLTPQQVIDELRVVGPQAVQWRQSLPWLLRKISMPMPELGFVSIQYLMDTIYPRDQWMHRIDICRATGKQNTLTPEHDGRMVELVMLDFSRRRKQNLSVTLQLTGVLPQTYIFGKQPNPQTVVRMDCMEFHRLASRRITPQEALQTVTISGDTQLAQQFIEHCEVPY